MKSSSLRKAAILASKNAYSPYSLAQVGCALETADGAIFTGCNIENASFGGTICAERVAILKAISIKKIGLSLLYVYSKDGWPPCGICRQMISEFATENLEIIIGNEKGDETKILFKDLMPYSFTPQHLSIS